MQDQRLLAHAGALALAKLKCNARTCAAFETQNLETQLSRARDVAERLAGILLGMKHAEALHDICRTHAVDGHRLDRICRTVRVPRPQRVGLCLVLRTPVEGRLQS